MCLFDDIFKTFEGFEVFLGYCKFKDCVLIKIMCTEKSLSDKTADILNNTYFINL